MNYKANINKNTGINVNAFSVKPSLLSCSVKNSYSFCIFSYYVGKQCDRSRSHDAHGPVTGFTIPTRFPAYEVSATELGSPIRSHQPQIADTARSVITRRSTADAPTKIMTEGYKKCQNTH